MSNFAVERQQIVEFILILPNLYRVTQS